jgi:hypothetical protein
MTTEQRLADLERQVAELTASLRRVAVLAVGLSVAEEMPGRDLVAAAARRPRHLQVVSGGRR